MRTATSSSSAAGLAGLFTALKLAPMPVTVLAAAPLGAGRLDRLGAGRRSGRGRRQRQRRSSHAADTIAAGAGIVDADVARFVARAKARAASPTSLAYGVPFDRDADGEFALSQEAAHSRRRVVHVSGDRTGAAIMRCADRQRAGDAVDPRARRLRGATS